MSKRAMMVSLRELSPHATMCKSVCLPSIKFGFWSPNLILTAFFLIKMHITMITMLTIKNDLHETGSLWGSFPLFQSHFHGVWRDPILPLSVITGFCRSTKAAGETAPAGLQALARPLLEDVLKQLERWDPKIGSWICMASWCLDRFFEMLYSHPPKR